MKKEEAIQAAVVDLLEHAGKPGLVFIHVPNGGVHQVTKWQRIKNKRLGVRAGAPDLWMYYRKQLFVLELKAEKGKISEDQIEMLDQLDAQGATVGVAYGLDAAIAWLQDKGLIRARV